MQFKFKIIQLICLLIIPFYNGISQDPNSDNDPFLGNNLMLESSKTPIPFGLILELDYTFNQANVYSTNPQLLYYGADLYLDSWQVGFQRKELGDFIQIQPRSLGRDEYTSFYLSLGSAKMIDAKLAIQEYNTDFYLNPSEIKGTFYNVGWKNMSGYSSTSGVTSKVDLYGGLLVTDIDHFLTLGASFDYGYRFPIMNTALFLMGGASVMYVNYNTVTQENFTKKEFGGFFLAKITIDLAYSINFNL